MLGPDPGFSCSFGSFCSLRYFLILASHFPTHPFTLLIFPGHPLQSGLNRFDHNSRSEQLIWAPDSWRAGGHIRRNQRLFQQPQGGVS